MPKSMEAWPNVPLNKPPEVIKYQQTNLEFDSCPIPVFIFKEKSAPIYPNVFFLCVRHLVNVASSVLMMRTSL